ncbi:hypothetical protein ACP70R_010312 [Stipagrostis hirtigluma subsp. patula]
MSRAAEAAVRRRAGPPLVALVAASALKLVIFPEVAGRRHVALTLALHAVFMLGCAAVLLSPAHRTLAELARRAAETFRAPARAATELRWAGFACIVFCTVYAAAGRRTETAVGQVNGFILFLVFLVGVWAVSLSMLTVGGGGGRRRT